MQNLTGEFQSQLPKKGTELKIHRKDRRVDSVK